MSPDEYLQGILKNQELAEDSPERRKLRATRRDVETLLRASFEEANPTIRYGGSAAKGTMIRECYDLDVICYFAHDDSSAGDTLEEVYRNVRDALSAKYFVEEKTSALRLKGKSEEQKEVDFHVDVVPGRFTDKGRNDVFLYQSSGEKKRLKTNPEKHIELIRDSGLTDAIKLVKLWKARKVIRVKTFVLELLVIEILKQMKGVKSLSSQLTAFWEKLKDTGAKIPIQDPANPSGNDLSAIFNAGVQADLSVVGGSSLDLMQRSGWESVFGPLEEAGQAEKAAIVTQASRSGSVKTKPWGESL